MQTTCDNNMKKIRMKILYFILWFFISATSVAYADPFRIPEKFVYDLTWTGIKAGTASLEMINDGDKLKIISTAQSAKWVSVFYTVDDRVESTLFKIPAESFSWQPEKYRIRIREGRHRRDKEVVLITKQKKQHSETISIMKRRISISLLLFLTRFQVSIISER